MLCVERPITLSKISPSIVSQPESIDPLLLGFFGNKPITRKDIHNIRDLCFTVWKDLVRVSETKKSNKYELTIETLSRRSRLEFIVYCGTKIMVNADVDGTRYTQYDLHGKAICVRDGEWFRGTPFAETVPKYYLPLLSSCEVNGDINRIVTISKNDQWVTIDASGCAKLKHVTYKGNNIRGSFGTRANVVQILKAIFVDHKIDSLIYTGYVIGDGMKTVYLDGELMFLARDGKVVTNNMDVSIVPEEYLDMILLKYSEMHGCDGSIQALDEDGTKVTVQIESGCVISASTNNTSTGWSTQRSKKAMSTQYQCAEYTACTGCFSTGCVDIHTSRFTYNLFDNNKYTYLHRTAVLNKSVIYEVEFMGGEVVVLNTDRLDVLDDMFLVSHKGIEFAARRCVIGPCVCRRSGPVSCRSCGPETMLSFGAVLCSTCKHRCPISIDIDEVCTETLLSPDGRSEYTFTYDVTTRGNINKPAKKITAVETSNGSIQSIDQHNYSEIGHSTNTRTIESDNKMTVKSIGSKDTAGGRIGYKAAKTHDNRMCIVKLMIPGSARVAWDKDKDKYRTDSAIVTSIKHVQFKKVDGKVKHYYDDDLEVRMCHICTVEPAEFMSHPCRHKACGNCWKVMIADYKDTCCFCRQIVSHVEKVSSPPLTTISVEMLDMVAPEVPMVFVDGISSGLPREDIREAFSSIYTDSFRYRVGELITIPDFDTDLSKPCAPGIHFHEKDTDIFQWFEYMDVPEYLIDTPLSS